MSNAKGLEGAVGSEDSRDLCTKLELAKVLMDHVEGQIRFADTKSLFIITASGFLANSLAQAVGTSEYYSLFHGGPIERTIAVLSIGVVVLLLIASYHSLVAIWPNLLDPMRINVFYFLRIQSEHEDEYIIRFKRLNNNDMLGAMLSEVHSKSRIVTSKFHGVSKSLQYLLIGSVLWALAMGLRFVGITDRVAN